LYAPEFTPELLQEKFEISAGKWSIEDGYLIGLMEEHGRVGLGVYASKVAFRDFKVYKPYVQKFEISYQQVRKNKMWHK
jgi:hypothetical protein